MNSLFSIFLVLISAHHTFGQLSIDYEIDKLAFGAKTFSEAPDISNILEVLDFSPYDLKNEEKTNNYVFSNLGIIVRTDSANKVVDISIFISKNATNFSTDSVFKGNLKIGELEVNSTTTKDDLRDSNFQFLCSGKRFCTVARRDIPVQCLLEFRRSKLSSMVIFYPKKSS